MMLAQVHVAAGSDARPALPKLGRQQSRGTGGGQRWAVMPKPACSRCWRSSRQRLALTRPGNIPSLCY